MSEDIKSAFAANRQAVVVIHGIGSQRPMAPLPHSGVNTRLCHISEKGSEVGKRNSTSARWRFSLWI